MMRQNAGRKGAGLIFAMVTMVSVFILCTALVTVSILHTGQVNRTTEQVAQRLTLERLMDAYCAAEAQGISWTSPDAQYRAQTQRDGTQTILCLLSTAEDAPVLTVVLEENRVLSWCYESGAGR